MRAAFAAHAPGPAKTLSPGTVRAMVRAKTKRGPSSFKSLPREHALALLAYALEDAEAKGGRGRDRGASRVTAVPRGRLPRRFRGGCISPDPDGRKPDPMERRGRRRLFHLSTDDEEASFSRRFRTREGRSSTGSRWRPVPGLLDKMDAPAAAPRGAPASARGRRGARGALLTQRDAARVVDDPARRGDGSLVSSPRRNHHPEKSTDEEHPSSAQLATLWRRLATLAPTPELMAPFEGAPLLPVDDGAALALTPHGAVVRGEGWSESASRALEALGVRRLAAEDPAGVAAAAHPLA